MKTKSAKRGLVKLPQFHVGKNDLNDRTRTKIITEPYELYRFLITPVIEVTKLAFASDDLVWLSWKLGRGTRA